MEDTVFVVASDTLGVVDAYLGICNTCLKLSIVTYTEDNLELDICKEGECLGTIRRKTPLVIDEDFYNDYLKGVYNE